MMRISSRVAWLGMSMGLAGIGCGTEVPPDPVPAGAIMPPLTAEEQVAVENMRQGTLAEIELPEGKMKFIEAAPGEILVTREFAMGSKLTTVPGESTMTVADIFRAYAPDRALPEGLRAAIGRLEAPVASEVVRPVVTAPRTFLGPAAATQVAPASGRVEQVTSALASSIDAGWFTNSFCNVQGADFTFCAAVVTGGAYAYKHSHRTGGVTCADTGAARIDLLRSQSVFAAKDLAYGQCWVIDYHGPHGLFGVNLERDLQHRVTWTEWTARFANWFADEDQFINNGY